MNDSTRRILTEKVLGERWHEPRQCPDGESIYCVCGACHWTGYDKVNRTFSTPQDAQDVKDALVRAGKWEEFIYWISTFDRADGFYTDDYGWPEITLWGVDWLFSYVYDSAGNRTGYRLLELAGEFLTKH